MIKLKGGIRLLGIKPEIVLASQVVTSVYEHMGHHCRITSGIEGTHSWGSEHYVGNALDYGLNDITPVEHRAKIVAMVKEALGEDFDVLHELAGSPGEHLHVEYDPKASY